jgi:phenylacetic acid degradation operon negative regulatory protein
MILLLAGVALGLSKSTKKQMWILRQIPKEFKNIERRALNRAINSLYKSHLISEKHNKNGTTTLILNESGRQKALVFNIDKLKIKEPTKWDNQWRIVMFDIPEKVKTLRDSLRLHLCELGFIELQKSAFIHPYPCYKEIEFLIESYNARKYIRFILANKIDNELHLKRKFKL